jgi:hypothetical protein
MKTLRRKKSRRDRVAALLGDYLKFKAVKGIAKRAPLKPLAIVGAAAGAAGIVAARKRGDSSPAAA